MRSIACVVAVVSFGLFGLNAWSCTFVRFGDQSHQVSAQNFDFVPGTSLSLVVNKRHVLKEGIPFDGLQGRPVSWVARFGSVTFGFGREQSIAGINEAGLSSFRLILMESAYPAPDATPALQENFWQQYLLDTSATVEEAIANARKVRIYSPYKYPTHFSVCDASARCAAFEFLGGGMKVTAGQAFRIPALTNTDHATSFRRWQDCARGNCGTLDNSLWRFVSASDRVAGFDGRDPLAAALKTLDYVKQTGDDVATLWSFLVEQAGGQRRVLIKNIKSSLKAAELDLSALDFSCRTPALMTVLSANDPGPAAPFHPYTATEQESVAKQMLFFGMSRADLQRMVAYPDRFTRCLD